MRSMVEGRPAPQTGIDHLSNLSGSLSPFAARTGRRHLPDPPANGPLPECKPATSRQTV